jgi:hypothetical protein
MASEISRGDMDPVSSTRYSTKVYGYAHCLMQPRKDDANEEVWIERPLATLSSLKLNANRDFSTGSNWAYLPIFRFWTYGYRPSQLAAWFDSIPLDIASILQQILAIMQTDMISRVMHLKAMGLYEPEQLVEHDDFCHWEDEDNGARTRIIYDPCTQQRRSFSVNRLLAQLFCMHPEELLARFANRELDLSVPATDFLYTLLDDVLHPTVARRDRYYRVSNKTHQGTLIATTIIKTFNSFGETVEVTYAPPCSPPTRRRA